MAGSTAWLGLFELGRLDAGQRVLINGASSGVGHYAVQLARASGAHVVAVCSERNRAFCLELGANEVIDYARRDFTEGGEPFDVVFDVVNNRSLAEVAPVLARQGVYIGTTPTPRLLWSVLTTSRARFVAVQPRADVLDDLAQRMARGELRTHVDRVYPLDEIAKAHRYAERQRTRGKVIIEVEASPRPTNGPATA
jgi:NADPH:quinone reductase-like Zn-dependent oxidoreductase